jgi:Trk-type K+ transport system membrane component
MTLKIVLYLAINRKISINDTSLAQVERGSTDLNSAIILIRDGFLFLTIVQLIAIGALFFIFYFTDPGMIASNQA